MKCEQLEAQLTPYVLGDLAEPARSRVREHIEECDRCRAVVRELEPTLDLLHAALAASSSAPQHLSAGHRRRALRASEKRPAVIRWLTGRHPGLLQAAALLLVCFVIAGLLLPAMQPAREKARRTAEAARLRPLSRVVDGYAEEEAEQQPAAAAELDKALQPAAEHAEHEEDEEVMPPDVPAAGKHGLRKRFFGGGFKISERSAGAAAPAEEARIADFALEAWETVKQKEAPAPAAAVPAFEPPPAPRPAREKEIGGEGGWSGAQPLPGTGRAEATETERQVATLGTAVVSDRADWDADGDAGGEGGARGRAASGRSIFRRDQEAREGEFARKRPERLRRGVGERNLYTAVHDGPEDVVEEPAPAEGLREARVAPPGDVDDATVLRYYDDESPQQDTGVRRIAPPTRIIARRPASDPAPFPPKTRLQAKPDDTSRDSPEEPVGEDLRESAVAAARERELERKEAAGREDEPTGPRFRAVGVNPFFAVGERPFSTFSIDVDTASYTVTRNYFSRGYLPPAESVRTEEYVNFFDYAYNPPAHATFSVYTECAPSPFGRGLHLLKIGVKGRRLGREERRGAVLTFLVDTSGSMEKPDRMGLVQRSLRLLVGKLDAGDRVAIVQYDSHARLVLDHTPASQREKILAAVDALQCGGSTNLEEGMDKAYGLAAAHFVAGAENRVLLLSDGVANLGSAAASEILARVERYRKQGILCSVFGFGIGTYDDEMLETLANKGDGAYAFIDSEDEARRVFVDDLAATLNTIARDVKIQVQFNPVRVKRYRQLGYENRQLKKEDFRNDAVDAGEVGSGQSVTALYEVELNEASAEDVLEHGSDRLGVVRVRYRRVDNAEVEETEHAVAADRCAPRFEAADARFRLAACVAEFAEILRGSPFAAGSEYEEVGRLLRPVALELELDPRIRELLRMVQTAPSMSRAPDRL